MEKEYYILLIAIIAFGGIIGYQLIILKDKINKLFRLYSFINKAKSLKEDLNNINFLQEEVLNELNFSNIILDKLVEGVLVLDKNFKIIKSNSSVQNITGYTEEELIGKEITILNSGNQEIEFYSELFKELKINNFIEKEMWNRKKNGEIYLEKSSIIKIESDNKYLYLLSDISYEKEKEGQLFKLAHHDTLTQLPNRFLFNDRLERSLESSKRTNEKGALIFLDLDHFKSINDTLGHHIGDLLLIEVSKRLKSVVRENDTVARLAGDEFTIILNGIEEIEDIIKIANKILSELSKPYNLEKNKLNVTSSLGISRFPKDSLVSQELIELADQSMYNAKEKGKNCFHIYVKEEDKNLEDLEEVSNCFIKSLENNEIRFKNFQLENELNSEKYFSIDFIWNNQKKYFDMTTIDKLLEYNNYTINFYNILFKYINNEVNIDKNKIYILKIPKIYFKQSDFIDIIKNNVEISIRKNIILSLDSSIYSLSSKEFNEKIRKLKELNFKLALLNINDIGISINEILNSGIDLIIFEKEDINTRNIINMFYNINIDSILLK